jgi:uroporphyrinogen-III synthase
VTFRVAVTRPEPQASDTAARLASEGYAVVKAPLLAAVPREGPGSAEGIGTLALTSRTAAQLLADRPRFHLIPVVAVGEATAAEARRAGFHEVRSADGDVEALLPMLLDVPGPVVHLSGEDQRGDLVERLRARGQAAERRILYAMEPAGRLPDVDPVDAVLLYSPRTAALFAERATAPAWRGATCIALSAAVAAPVADRPHVVAARPDEPALLAALHGMAARAGCTVPPG